MTETTRVRPATMEDLDEIVRLLHQLSPPTDEQPVHSARQVLGCMLQDTQYHLSVYDDDAQDRIAGTAMLLIQYNLSHGGRPVGHIENVVADREVRGMGIGKALVQDATRVACERGCYKVILDCTPENTLFYAKCGFHKTGEVEMRFDCKGPA